MVNIVGYIFPLVGSLSAFEFWKLNASLAPQSRCSLFH